MIRVTAPKNRSVKLGSSAGPSIFIPAGGSRDVQDFMAANAANQGCAISPIGDGEMPDVPQTQQEQAEADGERLRQLELAVERLIENGSPDDFTGNGRPRKASVQQYTEADFTTEELTKVFERVAAKE